MRYHKRNTLDAKPRKKRRLQQSTGNPFAGCLPSQDAGNGRDHHQTAPADDSTSIPQISNHMGYQQGCLGCKMMREGKPSQSHNEACRKRIEHNLNEHKDKRTSDQQEQLKMHESSDKRPADDQEETDGQTGANNKDVNKAKPRPN